MASHRIYGKSSQPNGTTKMIHFLLNFFSFFRKKKPPQYADYTLVFRKGQKFPDQIYGNIEKISFAGNYLFFPKTWKLTPIEPDNEYFDKFSEVDFELTLISKEFKNYLINHEKQQLSQGKPCYSPSEPMFFTYPFEIVDKFLFRK